MNVSRIEKDELLPFFNIVFYKSENGFYSEYAKIENNKAQSYKPVSYEAMDELFKTIKTKLVEKDSLQLNFSGIIPKNIIHFDPYSLSPKISWFCKGKERKINMNKIKGTLYFPHLIFKLCNNELFVYAIKTCNFNKNTELYIAPLPNIKSDHNLCWGTMTIKNFISGNNYEGIINRIEDAFFNSKFTTDYASGRTKSPTLPLLEDMLKNNSKRFPASELKPLNKTLKHVMFK